MHSKYRNFYLSLPPHLELYKYSKYVYFESYKITGSWIVGV